MSAGRPFNSHFRFVLINAQGSGDPPGRVVLDPLIESCRAGRNGKGDHRAFFGKLTAPRRLIRGGPLDMVDNEVFAGSLGGREFQT